VKPGSSFNVPLAVNIEPLALEPGARLAADVGPTTVITEPFPKSRKQLGRAMGGAGLEPATPCL
jgi:hypothetical protein